MNKNRENNNNENNKESCKFNNLRYINIIRMKKKLENQITE